MIPHTSAEVTGGGGVGGGDTERKGSVTFQEYNLKHLSHSS